MFRVVSLWFATIFVCAEGGLFQKTVLKIHQFEGYCDEFGTTPIGFENITLRTHNRMTRIDATMVVRENMTHKYLQDIGITKCKDIYTPDSCVNFKTLRFPDICKLYDAKNQMWSTFTSKFQPKIECPIQKGRYVLKDGYFDLSKSPIFMETNNYWKIRVQHVDLMKKVTVLCMNIGLEALPMKSDS